MLDKENMGHINNKRKVVYAIHLLILNVHIVHICKASMILRKFREQLWNLKVDFMRNSNFIGVLRNGWKAFSLMYKYWQAMFNQII